MPSSSTIYPSWKCTERGNSRSALSPPCTCTPTERLTIAIWAQTWACGTVMARWSITPTWKSGKHSLGYLRIYSMLISGLVPFTRKLIVLLLPSFDILSFSSYELFSKLKNYNFCTYGIIGNFNFTRKNNFRRIVNFSKWYNLSVIFVDRVHCQLVNIFTRRAQEPVHGRTCFC